MAGSPLDERLRIFRPVPDASKLASQLFLESFGAAFPVPREGSLPIATPPSAWRQYVATYRWPAGAEETVGFCNWIRYRDVYLQGGMCVRRTFYRHMPREQFRELQQRGGLAQMMMAAAERELNDCVAWFGYCGDAKALAVDLRAGYVKTSLPYIIVKWFNPPPEPERQRLIDDIAKVGPF
jgi:hypothetical protein